MYFLDLPEEIILLIAYACSALRAYYLLSICCWDDENIRKALKRHPEVFNYDGKHKVPLDTEVAIVNENIEAWAFAKCKKLAVVFFSGNIEIIGRRAFFECENLTNVLFQNKLLSIQSWAFARCPKLTNINLVQGINTVKQYAFYDCATLKKIKLPEGLEEVERYAFAQCPKLFFAKIPKSLNSIGKNAFFCKLIQN